MLFSLFAIFWANSFWYQSYFDLFNESIRITFFNFHFETTVKHIINDGLMTLFFLLVTLEIKRELLIGELNSLKKSLLPIFAASGGMLLPALIYLSINFSDPIALRGWAIPTATDIAFSLAILILLRSYIPQSLKIFLTALAIIDDLGAIIILAIFYSHQIEFLYLTFSILCLLILLLFNRFRVTNYSPYFIIGIILWLLIAKSGIHTTIAGVILGFTIPLNQDQSFSPLKKLEHNLNPWVAYLVLPMFALANSGLSFIDIDFHSLFHPITLGIILGLFVGKQLGIFIACWIAIKTKIASLPDKITWIQLYGMAILCGIGFTMSLFIGDLAFSYDHPSYINLVKLGVLSGSLISAAVGTLVLRST